MAVRRASPGPHAVPPAVVALLAGALALAVAVTLAVLSATGQLRTTAVVDPGALVRWALPGLRAVHDAAACLAVGLLVLAVLAMPDPSGDRWALSGARRQAVRWAGLAAAVWAASEAGGIVLTFSDVSGEPLGAPGVASQLVFFTVHVEAGRILLAALVVEVVVAHLALLATRAATAAWAAVLALAALLPLALAGHAAGSPDHANAVDSLAAHLLAVTVWVGGTAGLLLVARRTADLRAVVTRSSALAGWCFVVVAASGVDSAWLRLGSFGALGTSYGLVVVAKAALLTALGLCGLAHRRRLLRQLQGGLQGGLQDGLQDGARSPLLRLVAAEVVLMAVALGLAVALGRSDPPVSQTTASGPAASFRTLVGFAPPPSLSARTAVTQWYPDWLFIAAAAAMAGAYLTGVSRLRGPAGWPRWRTGAWLAGCALLVWATSGAPAVYGATHFSGHMATHMLVMVVVGPLLALGTPLSVLTGAVPARTDASTGVREWALRAAASGPASALAQPVAAAVVFSAAPVVLYETPLFGPAVSTHTGHVLTTVAFLAVGYLFAHAMVVVPAGTGSAYPLRLVVVTATMTVTTLSSLVLLTTPRVLAATWWGELGTGDHAALLRDQHRGAVLGWALGEAPALALLVALAVAWARSDDGSDDGSDGGSDGGAPTSQVGPGMSLGMSTARRGGPAVSTTTRGALPDAHGVVDTGAVSSLARGAEGRRGPPAAPAG